MSKLSMPVICECGYSTMDAKRAVEHAKEHEEDYCPKCGCHWITHEGDGSCVED